MAQNVTDERLSVYLSVAHRNGVDLDGLTALMVLLTAYIGQPHTSAAMHASGISAASFYPGNVVTNFAVDARSSIIRFVRRVGSNPIAQRVLFSTSEQGADQLVWLAEGTPGTDWESNAYYYKRKASKPRNPQAFDAGLARGLWERSQELVAERLPSR